MSIQTQPATSDRMKAVLVLIVAILVLMIIFVIFPVLIFLKIGGFWSAVIFAIYVVAMNYLSNKFQPWVKKRLSI